MSSADVEFDCPECEGELEETSSRIDGETVPELSCVDCDWDSIPEWL